MRVSESASTTTSCPISTQRFARESAISATPTCWVASSSSEEAMISPRMERRSSVTSSGRSLMRRTKIFIPG